jgi:hypothetical protein
VGHVVESAVLAVPVVVAAQLVLKLKIVLHVT